MKFNKLIKIIAILIPVFFLFINIAFAQTITPYESCRLGGDSIANCCAKYPGTDVECPTPAAQDPAKTTPSAASGVSCGSGFSLQNGTCIPDSPFGGDKTSLANSSSLMEIIGKVLKILLTVVGVIAVIVLIIGGFQYITSAGNAEQAEKGRAAITNAIIGLIVVTLSYAIVTIITSSLTKGIGN